MDTTFTKIFDRISEALNFFDFSFIVSGLITFGIIYCSINSYYTFDLSGYSKTVIIIAAIVMIYVSGLVSFSIGKWLRLKILYIGNKEYFNNVFRDALWFANHDSNCKSKELSEYLNDNFYKDKNKDIYSKMWLDLRHCEEAKETMRHLNRFWMMQAVYEGLFTSSIVAIISSLFLICKSRDFFIIMILLSIICMVFCYIEARRYAETQILEIVIAYKKFIAL
ncbi:hypothetical protein [Bacteroides sp. ET336]|uniref:hypothetical protein n=1 Tax=Bacteroides sp. ET336 TaxID=2972459 RepID=UPI0021AD228E|nr:hypothetical protein [Bacteroides sp. ET336]MCR8895087.1 hypothetical protein [Bacteroides sp. ET336]MDN0059583.1 hypothetical protein [Bacteroides caecigallinarum]